MTAIDHYFDVTRKAAARMRVRIATIYDQNTPLSEKGRQVVAAQDTYDRIEAKARTAYYNSKD